jgi:hypothetical protein
MRPSCTLTLPHTYQVPNELLWPVPQTQREVRGPGLARPSKFFQDSQVNTSQGYVRLPHLGVCKLLSGILQSFEHCTIFFAVTRAEAQELQNTSGTNVQKDTVFQE